MKILWVKPGKLLPLNTGGRLRSYHLLRQLSRSHEVTYLSFYDEPRDEAYERGIERRFPGAILLPALPRDPAGFHRLLEYVRRLPQSAPYAVSRFTSPLIPKLISDWMSQRRFDVAVCDFLASAPNFPPHLTIPTVLFQHNVESVLWKRRAQVTLKWTDRIVAQIECFKMTHYEAYQVQRFHHVLAVSEPDRRIMMQMTDASRISVVPTGVDLAEHQYDPALRPVAPLVVFTGSMDWEPNIDAMEYFCREIWPQVLKNAPEAMFRIVGRNPHSRVKKLASASVEVTGSVESVIEHLREAAVLVVPLRIGGGTRIKIYEGMAMGKATVSTSVGAEGLDVHDGRDILLADDPQQFAQHIVMLLRSESVRREYEVAAAAAVRKYDWSIIAEQLADELRKVVSFGLVPNAVGGQVIASRNSECTDMNALAGPARNKNPRAKWRSP